MADAALNAHPDHTVRPTRGLRGFSFVLSALTIVLWVSTAIVVPLSIAVATGHASVNVDATIDVPYVLDIEGEPLIEVRPDGSMTTDWGSILEDTTSQGIEVQPTLGTTIRVADSDLDSRAVASGVVLTWLLASWIGVVCLRRVVRTALSGRAFDHHNSGRLRWCAVAVLSAPVTAWIAGRLLEATLDPVDPRVQPMPAHLDWGVHVLVGLGLLALAEVFRSGAALQELEMQTV